MRKISSVSLFLCLSASVYGKVIDIESMKKERNTFLQSEKLQKNIDGNTQFINHLRDKVGSGASSSEDYADTIMAMIMGNHMFKISEKHATHSQSAIMQEAINMSVFEKINKNYESLNKDNFSNFLNNFFGKFNIDVPDHIKNHHAVVLALGLGEIYKYITKYQEADIKNFSWEVWKNSLPSDLKSNIIKKLTSEISIVNSIDDTTKSGIMYFLTGDEKNKEIGEDSIHKKNLTEITKNFPFPLSPFLINANFGESNYYDYSLRKGGEFDQYHRIGDKMSKEKLADIGFKGLFSYYIGVITGVGINYEATFEKISKSKEKYKEAFGFLLKKNALTADKVLENYYDKKYNIREPFVGTSLSALQNLASFYNFFYENRNNMPEKNIYGEKIEKFDPSLYGNYIDFSVKIFELSQKFKENDKMESLLFIFQQGKIINEKIEEILKDDRDHNKIDQKRKDELFNKYLLNSQRLDKVQSIIFYFIHDVFLKVLNTDLKIQDIKNYVPDFIHNEIVSEAMLEFPKSDLSK
jgi:hypothetical protein